MSSPAATSPVHDSAPAPGESKSDSGKIVVKDRVCDYYLSSRGCVKGEQCDFLHPVAPSGAATNRVCDFYSSPRGCVKGESCDFLHPRRVSPAGEVTNRVCSYYLSESGCLKGNQCDFLHPRVLPSGKAPLRQNVGAGGPVAAGAGAGAGGVPRRPNNTRVCSFYNTPAGCTKGLNCNFLHPRGSTSSNGVSSPISSSSSSSAAAPNTRKPCDYFFSRAGCKKGQDCPFSHTQRPASAAPPRAAYPPAARLNGGGPGGAPFKTRICDYYSTERGCVKGDSCDFIHQKDKVCDYYLSARGCKKGDLCDYRHTATATDGAAATTETAAAATE